MRALYYDGQLRLVNKQLPVLPVDEALVRVTAAGICNTDIEITHGYAGFKGILGHEFVGIVEQASTRSLIGKRVVGEINAGCGKCYKCLSGDPRHCPRRTVLGIVGRDGAFAEYLTLPEVNLRLVPDKLDDLTAVFAEPLAAACSILERVKPGEGDKVLILGDGKLGLLVAEVFRFLPCELLLVGKHASKLATAAKRGIDAISIEDFVPEDEGYDLVIEATGTTEALAKAVQLAKPRGKVVLKSTCAGSTTVDMSELVVKEVELIGSRCGRLDDALRLMQERHLDFSHMISEVVSLAKGIEAFETAAKPGVLKVLLRP
ncbi:MAG: alcohol dehydrogenase catalytic domain-containing protein [Acidobacteriota bacterium]|nr:alcohol dehydrogenase catalytic domain-containing protein [Blastocatellia bacterium]MDW8411439.1 alcohol dehydrogenase catalytic domain-containing protein [Acidobacteriota bacterium]